MLWARLASAQFLCYGQGWQDDQCASPFHLFYLPADSTGIAYFDGNGMLTDDPSNLSWNLGGLFQVKVRNPGVGNVFGAFQVLTNTGSPGAVLAINSGGWTTPNEDSLGAEITNGSGNSIQFYAGLNNAAGSAYMEGQTIAGTNKFPSTAFGAQLLTTDTHGYLYIPTTNGIPTGVPAGLPWQYAGTEPIVYDTAHGVLYCYHGGWAACDPAGGAGAITSLNHDVTATGPGAAAAEVTGITDSGSTDWQVTGTFANGKALGFVGGGLQAVSFQAPISPSSCGANTFGTSVSSVGALTCTQPAFTDIAGQWACSQRPAASAPGGGNDVNNSSGSCVSTVVAIHDASTTQLVFGTIPDSNPQATVLIRGAGSTSISGVAAGVIADTVTKHDYFINIQSLQPVDTSTRYLATSSSGTVLPGGVIESPNDFIAGHVGYKFYIIDSIGTASSMDCWVTLNGTLITGTDYNFTPGVTSPGVHTQATVATGSASASDTFGMACLYNGNFVTGPFGATIVFTVQLVLTP